MVNHIYIYIVYGYDIAGAPPGRSDSDFVRSRVEHGCLLHGGFI